MNHFAISWSYHSCLKSTYYPV